MRRALPPPTRSLAPAVPAAVPSNGTVFATTALHTAADGYNDACTLGTGRGSWNYAQDGIMTLANDNAFLLVPCFAVAPGATLSMSANKVVAQVAVDRTVDSSLSLAMYTGLLGAAVSNGFRQVSGTVANGFYTAGTGASDGGVRYASAQTYTSSPVFGNGLLDLRGVRLFNGRLLALSGNTSLTGLVIIGSQNAFPTGPTAGSLATGTTLVNPLTFWATADLSTMTIVSVDGGTGARGTLVVGTASQSLGTGSFTQSYSFVFDTTASAYSIEASFARPLARAYLLTSNA